MEGTNLHFEVIPVSGKEKGKETWVVLCAASRPEGLLQRSFEKKCWAQHFTAFANAFWI